jgi:hypothetical protein
MLSIPYATSEPVLNPLPLLILLGIVALGITIRLAVWANRRALFTFDTGTRRRRILSWAIGIAFFVGVFWLVAASVAALFVLLVAIL